MLYCDAHCHLPLSREEDLIDVKSLASALNERELEELWALKKDPFFAGRLFVSLGIHPYYIEDFDQKSEDMMEKACLLKKIDAIGECGFDLYDRKLKDTLEMQEKAFAFQADCAVRYSLPLVIHDRKAFDQIMVFRKSLSKVRAVYFHGFSFTVNEASSLLKHGINAYFGFGSVLLKGSSKAIECVRQIEDRRILAETDSPFQMQKGDVRKVYSAIAGIKEMDEEETKEMLENNFSCFLGL